MLKEYTVILLNLLSLIPATVFLYFPMRRHMRVSVAKSLVTVLLPELALIAVASLAALFYDIRPNTTRIPLIIIFFFIYYRSIDVHITKALFVYIHMQAVAIILYSFANGFDALIHPELGAGIFTMSDSLLQLLFVSVYVALVYYPVKKYGSELVDMLSSRGIWISATLIPGILLFFNTLMRVEKYESLFVNHVFRAFIALHSVSFVLLILLTVFFYFVVSGIFRETQTKEELRILKLQERYFKVQQQYMNETARVRHDFKHTIHTLERLASNGDIDEIKSFLSRYTDSMPKNEMSYFCENTAVNALLNYYMEEANKAKTKFTLEVSLPDEMPVSDVEMCAIIGNILENAIWACMEIDPSKRFIDLAVRVENNALLYIVAENSFSGKVLMEDGRYRTTHSGNGIGLSSVMKIARNCGGTARFSHDEEEFYSDVILPLKITQ